MQREGKKQLLIIEPKNELSFKGPYDHVVTQYFTLKNPTESTIAFKVKTTAPKKYCVRPNNGVVASNRQVQVAVMLQPGDLTQEKHKHKFMIQSVIVPNNVNAHQIPINVDELFKSAAPEEIMDSKFKCVFLDLAAPLPGNDFKNLASAQNFDHDNLSDGVSGGEDFVNGGSNSGGVYTNTSSNDNATADNDDSEPINGHSIDEQMTVQNMNKTSNAPGIISNNNQHNNNNSDNLTTTNSSDFDNNSSNRQDAASKLLRAEKEIRLLKDKLEQVQQYASKFSSQSSLSSKSKNDDESYNKLSETLFDNNKLMLKISVIVVIVSFVIGIFFGRMF